MTISVNPRQKSYVSGSPATLKLPAQEPFLRDVRAACFHERRNTYRFTLSEQCSFSRRDYFEVCRRHQ